MLSTSSAIRGHALLTCVNVTMSLKWLRKARFTSTEIRERERACFFRPSNIVSFMHIEHTISSFVSRNGIKIVMAHEVEVDKKAGLTSTRRERERASLCFLRLSNSGPFYAHG